jgi:hypothetical protein
MTKRLRLRLKRHETPKLQQPAKDVIVVATFHTGVSCAGTFAIRDEVSPLLRVRQEFSHLKPRIGVNDWLSLAAANAALHREQSTYPVGALFAVSSMKAATM